MFQRLLEIWRKPPVKNKRDYALERDPVGQRLLDENHARVFQQAHAAVQDKLMQLLRVNRSGLIDVNAARYDRALALIELIKHFDEPDQAAPSVPPVPDNEP